MRIKTILNQVYYLKSFVYKYDQIEEVDGSEAFIVDIVPRVNRKVICPITEHALGDTLHNVSCWYGSIKLKFDPPSGLFSAHILPLCNLIIS